MTVSPPTARPQAAHMIYVGDSETGLVHVQNSQCALAAHQVFLDVRTAVVRGYRLCMCCEQVVRLSHTV